MNCVKGPFNGKMREGSEKACGGWVLCPKTNVAPDILIPLEKRDVHNIWWNTVISAV